MYWIRSAVKRDQIYQSRVITIPQRLYENHKRIAKIRKVLTDANERAPTLAQLSEAVGMSEIQIERSDAAMAQKIHSLDQTIFNSLKPNKSFEDKENLYSVIESKTDDSYASRVEYQLFREDLVKALHSHLSDEEAKLLMLRYGLIEDKKRIHNSGLRTIAEVSRLAGLKPDKVRRILNRSLKQLEAVLGDDWRDYEREFEARFE
jgi:RNA polymerase primary sigma factor